MMRLLILMPLVLCNAQNNNDINDAANWLNEGDNTVTTQAPWRLNPTRKRGSLSCVTTDNLEGQCVKPQYCKLALPERDPATLFTLRIPVPETICTALLQCCPLDQIEEKPKETNMLPEGCGWSNPGGYSLRTSDDDQTGFSDYADFPWMVALLKKSYGQTWNPDDYICGGTLIHPSVVLTVAHRVDSTTPSQIKCRAGEWDFKSKDEIFPHQDRDVRKIAIHKDFNKLRVHYDVALLFLTSPFKLKDVYHIGIACLGRDMPAPDTLCYSMGWGRSFNDTNNTCLLKKIQLPMVDPNTCQRQLRNTRLGSNYQLHHSLCCAGGNAGRDTCVGDGGSSLVCPVPGSSKRYVVYGMVAYGVGCGQQNVPGVYAKVPAVLDWINRQMQGEQLTTSYNI